MQTYMAARVFVWTNGIVVVVKVVFFYCRRPPHFSDAASTLDEIRQTLSDSKGQIELKADCRAIDSPKKRNRICFFALQS